MDRYNLTICEAPRFIWFRNAKVGTRTIFSALQGSHFELVAESPYGCFYYPRDYEDYFKFAFVRNPWDRFLSGWMNKVVHRNHFDFDAETLAEMRVFENFIAYCSSLDLDSCDSHFRRQSKHIDLNELDFLGRHENFYEDLCLVFKTLGVSPPDDISENRSHGRKHYADYYTDETRCMIGEMYRKDIQLFGYSFSEK